MQEYPYRFRFDLITLDQRGDLEPLLRHLEHLEGHEGRTVISCTRVPSHSLAADYETSYEVISRRGLKEK